jgi:hypothetical protein
MQQTSNVLNVLSNLPKLSTWRSGCIQSLAAQRILSLLPGAVMQTIQVTWFNFTNQLYALVSDNALLLCGNLDNLGVNLVDPFAKHTSPLG